MKTDPDYHRPQAEENYLDIPRDDQAPFLQRYGQSIGVLSHEDSGSISGGACPGDDFFCIYRRPMCGGAA